MLQWTTWLCQPTTDLTVLVFHQSLWCFLLPEYWLSLWIYIYVKITMIHIIIKKHSFDFVYHFWFVIIHCSSSFLVWNKVEDVIIIHSIRGHALSTMWFIEFVKLCKYHEYIYVLLSVIAVVYLFNLSYFVVLFNTMVVPVWRMALMPTISICSSITDILLKKHSF